MPGHSRRANVSLTIAIGASAALSARVNSRPRTSGRSRVSKYRGEMLATVACAELLRPSETSVAPTISPPSGRMSAVAAEITFGNAAARSTNCKTNASRRAGV